MPTRISNECVTETNAMLERNPHYLFAAFLLVLVGLNAWRLEEWNAQGMHLYLTQPIMQTTLVDFACVLGVVAFFIRRDAKKFGLSWWWIVPTFPFMPTLGILAYFIVRRRHLMKAPEQFE